MCELCYAPNNDPDPIDEDRNRNRRDWAQYERAFEAADALVAFIREEMDLAYDYGYTDGLSDGARDALTLNQVAATVEESDNDEPSYVFFGDDEELPKCRDPCCWCYDEPVEKDLTLEDVFDTLNEVADLVADITEDFGMRLSVLEQQSADLGILLGDLRQRVQDVEQEVERLDDLPF